MEEVAAGVSFAAKKKVEMYTSAQRSKDKIRTLLKEDVVLVLESKVPRRQSR